MKKKSILIIWSYINTKSEKITVMNMETFIDYEYEEEMSGQQIWDGIVKLVNELYKIDFFSTKFVKTISELK